MGQRGAVEFVAQVGPLGKVPVQDGAKAVVVGRLDEVGQLVDEHSQCCVGDRHNLAWPVILAAHPRLAAEDIPAALAFAASTLREHFAA